MTLIIRYRNGRTEIIRNVRMISNYQRTSIMGTSPEIVIHFDNALPSEWRNLPEIEDYSVSENEQ